MNALDMKPADAAVLGYLLHRHLFAAMSVAADNGHDLDVQVDRRGAGYVVMLHVLDGDRVVAAEEIVVPPERLRGQRHLLLVLLWCEGIVESAGRRRLRQEREIEAAFAVHGMTTPRW